MGSGSMATLAAGACFLLGAVACMQRSENQRAAVNQRGAVWLGAAGTAILAGGLVARGMRAGHWPLASHYEFTLVFALATALAALLLPTGQANRSLQAVGLFFAAALVAYARLGMPAPRRAIQAMPIALSSAWLLLHAGVAALAYGALTLAGAAGLVWLGRASDRAATEWLLDRAIAVGYPLLTLSMVLGMIWAQVAWGRYWSWDLKEIWTFITWLVYCLYWHVRRRPRWQGHSLAGLALAGLAALLFTFFGIGWLARTVGVTSLYMF
jgi:ABC-type transport system involved in cytochrome c biogenesis permease subunit